MSFLKNLLGILFLATFISAPLLADVVVNSTGAGAKPGDQSQRICVEHRDVKIGFETGTGINVFDYRTGLYAFTGEQIEFTVVIRDPNGALDIGFPKIFVGNAEVSQPEALCNELSELPEFCNGLGALDPTTDKAYHCLLTVEPYWEDEKEIKIIAYNSALLPTKGTHVETWHFNPALMLQVSTSDGQPIRFEDMPYMADTPEERTVHSVNRLQIRNLAEGGVNYWLFIAGKDFYDPSGASKCPTSNVLTIDNMAYRAWTGTQWTSWEGWEQMSKYDQDAECSLLPIVDFECAKYKPEPYICSRYVDWNETRACEGNLPCHTSIQKAIDQASENDVICVYSGNYKGNIIVYKEGLKIHSLSGPAVTIINASEVDKSGYTNQWGKGINYAWAENNDPGLLKNGFLVWSDNVEIEGFKILEASYPTKYNRGIGILVGSIDTTYAGFVPWNIDQWGGLISPVDKPRPTGVVLANNIIEGASDGIYIWASNGNKAEHNQIRDISGLGGTGIIVYDGGSNNIFNCNLIEKTNKAITIAGAGDTLRDVSNTQISNNILRESNISIHFYNAGGSGGIVKGNKIETNGMGIYIDGVGGSQAAKANGNSISGNTIGAKNDAPDGVFDARNNWWGSASGPSGEGPGNGDPVGNNILFIPWISTGSCYGGKPLPYPNTKDTIPDVLENVLTNRGLLEVEFKLTYPMPCVGNFSQGSIMVFGKAI